MKKVALLLGIFSAMASGMEVVKPGQYVVVWGNKGEIKKYEIFWVEQKGSVICPLTPKELADRGFKQKGTKIEVE